MYKSYPKEGSKKIVTSNCKVYIDGKEIPAETVEICYNPPKYNIYKTAGNIPVTNEITKDYYYAINPDYLNNITFTNYPKNYDAYKIDTTKWELVYNPKIEKKITDYGYGY